MQVRKRKRRNKACAKSRVARQNGNKEQLHVERQYGNWAGILPTVKNCDDKEGGNSEGKLERREQKRPGAGGKLCAAWNVLSFGTGTRPGVHLSSPLACLCKMSCFCPHGCWQHSSGSPASASSVLPLRARQRVK